MKATFGSGTRDTFDKVLDLDRDRSGPGRLIVFQRAAGSDAQEFDVTVIPIEFSSE